MSHTCCSFSFFKKSRARGKTWGGGVTGWRNDSSWEIDIFPRGHGLKIHPDLSHARKPNLPPKHNFLCAAVVPGSDGEGGGKHHRTFITFGTFLEKRARIRGFTAACGRVTGAYLG